MKMKEYVKIQDVTAEKLSGVYLLINSKGIRVRECEEN